MRILISNPDNIGDVVLRQPMYAALASAGHELAVVVRSFVEPIAHLLAAPAQILSFESNPYSPDFDPQSPDIIRVVSAARQFAPDVFCIAPYQRTVFDEHLAVSLPSCPTVGMSGVLYAGDINAGLMQQSKIRFDRQAPVSLDWHESRKNEALCAEILGAPVRLPDPAISPSKRDLDEAASIIARLGLQAGQFWAACVGQTPYTAVKNWGMDSWAAVLAHAVNRYGQQVVLIGTPDEHDSSEEVRRQMGKAADGTVDLTSTPPPLPVTAGLIQLSAGYIGKDTGTMHIAAALGKPVIAVFGGGHWPRFTPACRRGFVATVSMPCTGCDWVCHLPESYCVKRVPVERVIDGMDALMAMDAGSLTVSHIPMDPTLSACTVRKSAEAYRSLLRKSASNGALAARRAAEDMASTKAAYDAVEAQLRAEQARADVYKKDMAKLRNLAETEKQNVTNMLNDLLVQHAELNQKMDENQHKLQGTECQLRDSQEKLRETERILQEHRQSISFRLLVLAGRPVAAIQRLLGALTHRG